MNMNDSKNIKALVSARTFTQQNSSSQNATVQNAVSFAGGSVQAITVLEAVALLTSPRNVNAVGAVGEYVYISGTHKLVKITSAPANQNTYLVIGNNCVEVVGTFTIVARTNNTVNQIEIVSGNTYSIDGMVAPVMLSGSITVADTLNTLTITRNNGVGNSGQYLYIANTYQLVRMTADLTGALSAPLVIGSNCVEVTGVFTITARPLNSSAQTVIVASNTYIFTGTATPVRQMECGSITVKKTANNLVDDHGDLSPGEFIYVAGTERKLLRALVAIVSTVDLGNTNCVEVTGVFTISGIAADDATIKDIKSGATYKFVPSVAPAPIAFAADLSYPVVCGKLQAMSSGSIQLVNDYIICKTSGGQLNIIV